MKPKSLSIPKKSHFQKSGCFNKALEKWIFSKKNDDFEKNDGI